MRGSTNLTFFWGVHLPKETIEYLFHAEIVEALLYSDVLLLTFSWNVRNIGDQSHIENHISEFTRFLTRCYYYDIAIGRKGFPTIAISHYLRVCPWMPIQYFQTFRNVSNIRGA